MKQEGGQLAAFFIAAAVSNKQQKSTRNTDRITFSYLGFRWCPEADSNHRHADFQSSEESNVNNQVSPEKYQDKAGTAGEPDTLAYFRTGNAAKKNPDALAGAIGADFDIQDWLEWVDNNLRRESTARALTRAVVNCDPEDRLLFLETLVDGLRAGMPSAVLSNVMQEAMFWSDAASRVELKAYCLACFNRLTPADQAGFLAHVERRAAA